MYYKTVLRNVSLALNAAHGPQALEARRLSADTRSEVGGHQLDALVSNTTPLSIKGYTTPYTILYYTLYIPLAHSASKVQRDILYLMLYYTLYIPL